MAGTIPPPPGVDLDLLPLFVAVAETTSFSAAARRLGLPKSSVSRGIAALEAALRAPLFYRTTRQVSLTTAGAALLERTAPLLAGLREALGQMPETEQKPSGTLRITAPHDVGALVLADVVSRFSARHPDVHVDVWLTNRPVDLVAEGFDLALRAARGAMRDSSLVMRRLGPVDLQLYAAPEYVARRGTPRSPDDGPAHDWVVFRGWAAGAAFGVRHSGAHIVADDFLFIRAALRAGAGVGPLPAFVAAPDVLAGQLVRVCTSYRQSSTGLVLLHPRADPLPRRLTAFRDFLVESLAARPLSPGSA